jgi:hypothetical protein
MAHRCNTSVRSKLISRPAVHPLKPRVRSSMTHRSCKGSYRGGSGGEPLGG